MYYVLSRRLLKIFLVFSSLVFFENNFNDNQTQSTNYSNAHKNEYT